MEDFSAGKFRAASEPPFALNNVARLEQAIMEFSLFSNTVVFRLKSPTKVNREPELLIMMKKTRIPRHFLIIALSFYTLNALNIKCSLQIDKPSNSYLL